MRILGIGHYSRTGKDTLANMIIEHNCNLKNPLKIKKISLAWKLKQICYELYGWAGMREAEFYDTVEGEEYRDIKLEIGKTPVEIWVEVGMALRSVYADTWLNYVLMTDHDCDLLIVPDVRFPNEASEFRRSGAKLVKVVRGGYGPRDTPADLALVGYEGWDLVAGPTLADLKVEALLLLYWAGGGVFPPQDKEDREHLLSLEKL